MSCELSTIKSVRSNEKSLIFSFLTRANSFRSSEFSGS